MSFSISSFITWVHDELVALRAAVARLESHTGSPESKPAVKPDDTTPSATTALPTTPTATPLPAQTFVPGTTVPSNSLLDAYMQSGGNGAQAAAQPAQPAPADDPDWNAGMGYKTGLISCPYWWWSGGGFVRAQGDCEIHFVCDVAERRDIVVNQGSIPQAPRVTVESAAGTVTLSLAAPSAQHAGVVNSVNGEIVVKLSGQDGGGCVVNLYKAG